ncbi:membrane protein insertase YidC [Neoehrlichia mikurensis]|uniref:Membrane protein insertase YidC n=1 Tax=Neoehrlichia mikurensis TaxID=89586 RepID=A0A9Q9F4N7_9RICK|nr:membrane protein insertase YidC [Neoehrlichia mikurensis]QXK92065.1 membrane protein insertase YidC [Neoehrlichia mikurensis]QXK92522.1 membrane protein insertase YidC [Neoehrlichia mikurensis]QXK93758.1 membrane protein insertase YidC [Neoehrlichia mikurensis]UTO55266.1 membrane protein insertase YidC [Neoehrlichia mikurensis]UTO56187.1 membrane protein insertase YidC [Neoehrlichia mikurensis]
MSDIRNLILAVVISIILVMGWRLIYEKFFTEHNIHKSTNADSMIPEVDNELFEYKTKSEIISQSSRIKISNEEINGSISVKGGIIDDITLKNYHTNTDKKSNGITLLSPQGTEKAYLVEFGWIDPSNTIKLPDKNTTWKYNNNELTSNNFINLYWDNTQGIVFKLKIHLDNYYMFKVEQIIENNTDSAVNLIPYGRINRLRNSNDQSHWISHEGAVGGFGNVLKEWTYKDMINKESIKYVPEPSHKENSWIGLSDKYWFVALIPTNIGNSKVTFHAKHAVYNQGHYFQTDFSRSYQKTLPHSSSHISSYLFVGSKKLNILDKYKDTLNIPLFDKAVDFGILYFITKPVFLLLEYFHKIIGNFGLSILMLTILIKLAMLPLSNKSYISMFKLKQIQPQILKIKELYKNDTLKTNKEIALLFKKHNVSPISGFLPILIQIPVFFALYKVLFITIEMRHAPFFLWIKDLSSADTANILTLFGMIKFTPPICIGILPVILGITMVIQQKISDHSYDKAHYNIMKYLPYIFIFIFSSFPAGLIIYWICSNTITILQQLVIKHFILKKSQYATKITIE